MSYPEWLFTAKMVYSIQVLSSYRCVRMAFSWFMYNTHLSVARLYWLYLAVWHTIVCLDDFSLFLHTAQNQELMMPLTTENPSWKWLMRLKTDCMLWYTMNVCKQWKVWIIVLCDTYLSPFGALYIVQFWCNITVYVQMLFCFMHYVYLRKNKYDYCIRLHFKIYLSCCLKTDKDIIFFKFNVVKFVIEMEIPVSWSYWNKSFLAW